MKVKELIELLGKFPSDMVVLKEIFSDYDVVTKRDFSIEKAVPKDEWYMRAHPAMSLENKLKAREYLVIAGN